MGASPQILPTLPVVHISCDTIGFMDPIPRASRDIPSILSNLRKATGEQHALLDALVESRRAFDSIDGYRGFILAMSVLHIAAGRAVGDRGRLCWPEWDADAATQALLADMDALGALPPMIPEHPPVASTAAAYGTLYVLIGSTMGARVLLPRLMQRGFASPTQAKFLATQAADRSAWPSFVARLTEADLSENDEAVLSAARATFEFAIRAVSEYIPVAEGALT